MRYFYYVIFLFLLINISCEKNQSNLIEIGFSQCTSNSNWRKSMNYSMQVQASVYSNVELSIYDSEDSPEKQIKDIEQMIEDKVDIIIVSPLEPNLIVDVLEKAENQGIPVVLLDRKVNSDIYTAYLGADNIEVGRKAGSYVVSSIVSSAKKTLNVIEIKGGDFSTPALERSMGFHQIVDKNPQVNVVQSIEGASQSESFKNVLDSIDTETIY